MYYTDFTKAFVTCTALYVFTVHGYVYWVLWKYKMGMFNLIYTRKKSAALPMAIFSKFTNVQRHYEQISYIEFHRNWKTNEKVRPEIHFRPSVKYCCLWADFHEVIFTQYISVNIPCTNFYPNRMKKCRKYGYIFIDILKKTVAFIVPTFMKLKNVQLHCVKIYYIEFHLRTSIKKESESRISRP